MGIKRILVSQPKPDSEKSPYYEIAEKYGVDMIFRPFIKVEGLSAKEFRQSKLNLADYGAVIFTARHAVDNYFRLCEEMRVEIKDDTRYFCTTEAIALYLQKYIVYRKRKIFFGTSGKLDDPQLVAAMKKNLKLKFLYPVSDVHKGDQKALDAAKIPYTRAVMYRTVSNDFGPDEPLDFDMLLFFSPSGIDALMKNFPEFNQEESGIKIGCFGATTAKAVEQAGLHLDVKAPTPESPSMTAALEAYLHEHQDTEE